MEVVADIVWKSVVVAATAALVVAVGCAPMPAGPHSSAAPFVQLDGDDEALDDDRGKVSAALGYYPRPQADLVPTGSSSFSWWFAEYYDLAVVFDATGVGPQGLLTFAESGGMRMGLIHGGSVNVGDDFVANGSLTGGLFAEYRYTPTSAFYGSVRHRSGLHEENVYHYGDLSVGWMTRVGVLQMGPELIANLYPDDRLSPFSAAFQLEAAF